jgi:DNA-binding protein Fis
MIFIVSNKGKYMMETLSIKDMLSGLSSDIAQHRHKETITEIRNAIEREILDALMLRCRYNQTRAAIAYNVSRGTFRKILKTHFGDKYIKD